MARARKKATKRKAKKKTAKRKAKKKAVKKRRPRGRAVARRPRVPARKKGESAVAYHDRLSDLIYEAHQAGDEALCDALQQRAGELARDDTTIHRPRRGKKKTRRGPGTYPWYECIDDQMDQYGDYERAAAVCGRIRADSRARYPIYWSARGLGRRTGRMTRTRSGWGANPAGEGDYAIFVADDESGHHWWVMDQRGGGLAAASTKPYRTDKAAEGAAKRAARAHDQRVYAKATTKEKTGNPKGQSGRGRLPSILTRL